MKKNEEKMSEGYLEEEQLRVDRKSYESPSLMNLGKMQQVTKKFGSYADGATETQEELF